MQHRQIGTQDLPNFSDSEFCQISADKSRCETQASTGGNYLRSKIHTAIRASHQRTMDISVEGPLNDEAPLPQFPNRSIELIVIDWSRTSYINSAGIVSWLGWLRLAQEQKTTLKFEYRGCSLALLEVFQKVPEMRPKNTFVSSIQIPFRRGDLELNQIITLGADARNHSARELLARCTCEIEFRTHDLQDADEIEFDLTEADFATLFRE